MTPLQQVRSPFPPPEPRESQTGDIIVFLSAIVAAAASIIVSYAQLPRWFIFIVALLALSVVLVLVKKFFWPPLYRQISGAGIDGASMQPRKRSFSILRTLSAGLRTSSAREAATHWLATSLSLGIRILHGGLDFQPFRS